MSNTTRYSSDEICPICGNLGWVYVDEEEETVERCSCFYTIRARRINAKSGFPSDAYDRMTFDKFVTETEEQKQMLSLAEDFVAKQGKGLGFFGKSGTGKTHLCIAVCQEMTRKYGLVHRYFSYPKEMHNLLANYYGNDRELFNSWTFADILYIDDLFKDSAKNGEIPKRELQVFYEILNERVLNRKTTIFSSEYTLKEIIGIDNAIGSRIYEMINPYGMKCEGNNYRIKRGV